MSKKSAVLLILVLAGGLVAQTWVYGPRSIGYNYTRLDGEYFPGTGKVYFLGGRLADASTNGTIWSYDPVAQTYAATGATMPTPISNYEIALLRDNYDLVAGDTYGLYVFGGRDNAGGFINLVQVYYPRTNRVVTVTSDPYPNNTSGIYYIPASNPVYNNKAYVLGGFQNTAAPYYVSRAVWVYDPLAAAGSRWTQLSFNLNYGRGYIQGAVVDSFLFACGGDTFDGTSLWSQNYVERLNLNTPTGWTVMTPMPQICGEARAFGFGGSTPYYRTTPGDLARKMITAGRGFWPAETTDCYIYDVPANTWNTFPSLNKSRRDHAGAFIPGSAGTNGVPGIWVWGGRHTSDAIVMDTSEYFQFQRVTVHDVGCTKIVAPSGAIPQNAVITPACSVYDYGTASENYTARMKIGAFYDYTAGISGHGAGTYLYVTFPTWTASQLGTHTVACSTELAGDAVPANDKQTGSVTVNPVTADVGVTRLAVPSTVDSGTSVTPACSVYNYGSTTPTYDVRMKIGASYNVTTNVASHAPGTYRYCTFATWTALPRGPLAASCSTELSGDATPSNDKRTGTVTVAVHDVAAIAIVSPTGSIPPGAVTPRATVRNNGTAREAVDVVFSINAASPYAQTLNFPGGLPLAIDTTVSFPDWTAITGSYNARCTTRLTGDQIPANNVIQVSFSVGAVDVGVARIAGPTGSHDTSDAISPSAWVKNFGAITASFEAYFEITHGGGHVVDYLDSLPVSTLAGGESLLATFTEWVKPHAPGSYATLCSTYLAGDGNPANDVAEGDFSITAGPSETGWVRKADVPIGPKNKKVKDGGCLVAAKGTLDVDLIYAFKGSNTCEFYQYNTETNTWASKESIPAIGRTGKKKCVKKGSALCFDKWGGKVYATKGNNTQDFWTYDIATGTWTQKADVPMGGGKALKEGTGLVFKKSGPAAYTVYLLKGSNTTEFWAYDVGADVWTSRKNAPAGASGKPFKDGSCLVDAADYIYALKAGYNELFAYDADLDTWISKAVLPLIGSSGKKKKVKSGGSMADHDRTIYALKGGNTNEFWSYQCDSNRWLQKLDMPLGAGKRVKGGGSIVESGGGLYATKGSNTLEFYKYGIAAADISLLTRDGSSILSSSALATRHSTLAVAPNPFSGVTTISYSLPEAGNVSLKLYDVTGALVTTFVTGNRNSGAYTTTIDAARLARGIYVLKLEAGNTNTTAKLIIE
jgi:hypothetical protein